MKQEISMKDFQQLLKRRIVTIILTMCCLTVSLILISMYVLKPSYQYSTQILVGNLDGFNKENAVNKTQENKQLVTSYVDILKSPLIISTVKKTLKLEQSSYELAQKISVVNMDNSQIVTVTVKDSDPKIVKEIVKSLAEQSQKSFQQYTNVQGIKILTDPELQEKAEKLFPKFQLIIPISLIVSFFVGVGLAVFRDYFDERIYEEQDLEKITTVSVIGHINMKPKRKKKSTEVDPQSSIYRGEHVDV
ncbi:capsule biosynthesis protein CapK [Bacillus cereus]|uniref:Capsule biosynthesis protein CapK n=2 Tax=Bacillus cereus group TaxID=86661 RepID=A0A2B1D4L6_BACCE|nr:MULTISPECIES: Wzz/FepE/Etk N-terminal domain-containing protein [Bacillus cereus group]ALQ67315.1 capsule biosynthesis protein CapK [Bacillus thuringiensis]OUA11301.1 capsule biosynthesis protein CapK [Bacillus thuringiensis serovar finitimus]PEC87227.1 capsule biosynthesis protein CapK [Bacillus cereus]PEQ50826.1 capsule biosynthesis protein CapK [Bacillus cereus]PEX39243.1 capsule biosynthesis protein CapK [Bacillus cereus]